MLNAFFFEIAVTNQDQAQLIKILTEKFRKQLKEAELVEEPKMKLQVERFISKSAQECPDVLEYAQNW